MNGIDSFFVSEGLEHLFGEAKTSTLMVNGVEGQFISYSSIGRLTKFEVRNTNPFEITDSNEICITINLPGDSDQRLLYKDWVYKICLLYTSPSPRDVEESRMPSSA